MKIYMIVGSCGDDVDHSSWNVKAYTDQNEAVRFTEKLGSIMHERKVQYLATEGQVDRLRPFEEEVELIKIMSKHDAKFDTDYLGTDYRIELIELVE